MLPGVGKKLSEQLSERIMVMDGAMGTMIQSHKLEEEDFRGKVVTMHTFCASV